MIFTYGNKTLQIPPPLYITQAICAFVVMLNSNWTYPTFVEWELYMSRSSDMVNWEDWVCIQVSPCTLGTVYYSQVDPRYYYRFKCRIRTKQGQSDFSLTQPAGKPKILIYNSSSSPPGYVISEYVPPAY